jgi:predicted O-methyltransferase YrrM
MSSDLWAAVDDYVADHLLPQDPVLDAALTASDAAGLPPGIITPAQGKLLELLARVRGAQSILELGTPGGYSTIWLARALPQDGRLVTLELDPRNAEVASANLANAGLAERVQIRIGPARETLPELHDQGAGPFDMIFIDADKQNNPLYLQWSLKLSRPGTLIIADNVVRGGTILDPQADDPRLGDGGIQGVRRFYEMLAAGVGRGLISATAIQTVTAKGHDGFVLALVCDTAWETSSRRAPPVARRLCWRPARAQRCRRRGSRHRGVRSASSNPCALAAGSAPAARSAHCYGLGRVGAVTFIGGGLRPF